MMRAIRQFLARHPELRDRIRRARGWGRRVPVLGGVSARLEAHLLSHYATERYDADDPADAHEYFASYADWILQRIGHGAVLDLGAGYGFLTSRIATKGGVHSVTAIDQVAPERFRFSNNPRIRYLQQDIATLDQLPGTFDVVVATEFIEHIAEEDLRPLFVLVRHHLKPGGVFVGSTPEDDGGLVSPFHLRQYTRAELEKLLRAHFHQVFVARLASGCLVWEASE